MKASLIVAASGRDTHLVNTLRCALAQHYAQLEILVVDSVDDRSLIAEDFLTRKQERIRYVSLPKHSRLALYNYAMTQATGDVLIFINDHASFGPHFVNQHMACYLDDKMGAVQGRVVTSETAISCLPTLTRTCQLKGHFNCNMAGTTKRLGEYNFSVRRSAVDRIGAFDEQMGDSPEWVGADYGVRCYKAGWNIRFESQAELVVHGKQAIASERLRRQCRLEGHHLMAQSLFAYRHLSPLMRFFHRFQQRWQGWSDIQHQQKAAWIAAEADLIKANSNEDSPLTMKVMAPHSR